MSTAFAAETLLSHRLPDVEQRCGERDTIRVLGRGMAALRD